MRLRFPAVLLAFCALGVTDATARPHTVPDEITAVAADGSFTLRDAGTAVLSGVIIEKPERVQAVLKGLHHVEVKNWGQDRYNRAIVMLFVGDSKTSVQEDLLAQGAVIAYDHFAIAKPWLEAEGDASAAHRGAWNDALVIGPQEAGDHVGELHVVDGVIRRVYYGRSMVYLNFGDNWRSDFSLRIPRRAQRSFKKILPLSAGTHVRARGAIFLDNGPMIELTRPEQLEVR